MEKINVLHVVQTLDVGGLERVVVDSFKYYDRNKFNFTVCCLSEEGILAGELKRLRMEPVFLNKRNGLDFSISCRIMQLIKKNDINILHTHNQRPLFYGAIAARTSDLLAYVHTRHGRNDPDSFKNVLINKFFSSFADRVVCVSRDIYEIARKKEGLPLSKIEVIRNGIDISKFASIKTKDKLLLAKLGIKEGSFVIGTVGRLSRIKNHTLLIDAFKNLSAKYSRAILLVVGDGPEAPRLKKIVQEYGLTEKILFLGEQTDVSASLGLFDIFVLPSLSEGISLVLIEAMAAGLPIVATNVGGNSEVISDGENGFLVSSGDTAALSNAIARLLEDEGLRRRLSDANRHKATQEFNIQVMCKKYEELYTALAGN
ncbi:MAG: glycosyltransferase [Candidatus Omnitrophota bacterium]